MWWRTPGDQIPRRKQDGKKRAKWLQVRWCVREHCLCWLLFEFFNSEYYWLTFCIIKDVNPNVNPISLDCAKITALGLVERRRAPALPFDRFMATTSSRATRTFLVHKGEFVSRQPPARVLVRHTTLFWQQDAVGVLAVWHLRTAPARREHDLRWCQAVLQLQEVWYSLVSCLTRTYVGLSCSQTRKIFRQNKGCCTGGCSA
jgi:hypothetical protein